MVELMDPGSDTTQQERYASVVSSFKAHGAYLRQACIGMGIDRHLLAMRVIAMKMKRQTRVQRSLFSSRTLPLIK